MFSDTSPNSHHAEEGVQLFCVVSGRHRINGWKLQEKKIFGSNSELSSNYSCPKMQLAVSKASQVLVVSLGTQTEIKMTSCQNVTEGILAVDPSKGINLCQWVMEKQQSKPD